MTTRLRRTFSYPSSSSSDTSSVRDLDDELDDDQQSALIETLRARDASTTALYRLLFALLPGLVALLYLPALFRVRTHYRYEQAAAAGPPPLRSARLLALLALSSLAASAWTMWALELPPVTTSRDGGRLGGRKGAEGPVADWLPLLNGVLAGVLVVSGLLLWGKGDGANAVWCTGPGAVYVVVIVARRELRPVGVEGLERLRYTYRGA